MQLASSELDQLPSSTRAPAIKQPRLDDTETIILVAAANRSDRIVLPVPDSITAPHDKVEAKLKRLLRHRLIEETPAKLEDGRWRKDEQDSHITLRVTAAGCEAIGIEPPGDLKSTTTAMVPAKDGTKRSAKASKPSPHASAKPASKRTGTARASSKYAKSLKTAASNPNKSEKLLTLLKRPSGATLAELIKSSGWQAHSVRGFLSAVVKKKLKLKLVSEEVEKGRRCYRIRQKAKG